LGLHWLDAGKKRRIHKVTRKEQPVRQETWRVGAWETKWDATAARKPRNRGRESYPWICQLGILTMAVSVEALEGRHDWGAGKRQQQMKLCWSVQSTFSRVLL
jgi:hypothetical protein